MRGKENFLKDYGFINIVIIPGIYYLSPNNRTTGSVFPHDFLPDVECFRGRGVNRGSHQPGPEDMAVFFDDKIYIIELKCNQDANKAIRQMVEKRYADRYKEDEKRIILIGINFDTNKRAVTDWKKQRLDR